MQRKQSDTQRKQQQTQRKQSDTQRKQSDTQRKQQQTQRKPPTTRQQLLIAAGEKPSTTRQQFIKRAQKNKCSRCGKLLTQQNFKRHFYDCMLNPKIECMRCSEKDIPVGEYNYHIENTCPAFSQKIADIYRSCPHCGKKTLEVPLYTHLVSCQNYERRLKQMFPDQGRGQPS
jgi:DNA-directed RNA polymerase subunit RPC12/RpoP